MSRAWLLALCLISLPALAWQGGGHLKLQTSISDYPGDDLMAVYAGRRHTDVGLDLRLKAARRSGDWAAEVHYELLALQGDSVKALAGLQQAGLAPASSPLPGDARRLFDLSHTLVDDGERLAVQRLDRLSLAYTQPDWLLKIGRQALSWGNGLVFQPLDFLNPFSPLAVDKDYKTGDDMLYGQYLFADGSDLQAVLVGRRDAGGDASAGQSTLALKYHHVDGLDLMLARHYAETRLGLGLARDLGEAVGRLDIDVTPAAGDTAWSLLANVDTSWVWGGRNWYGFAEYFHDSLGADGSAGYSVPDPRQAERLARGERYNLGRDYLAAGVQIEWQPLLNLHASTLVNLHDGSRIWQLRGVYDWRENLQLMAGLDIPDGEQGDEFGGVPVAGTPYFSAPDSRLYLRVTGYF